MATVTGGYLCVRRARWRPGRRRCGRLPPADPQLGTAPRYCPCGCGICRDISRRAHTTRRSDPESPALRADHRYARPWSGLKKPFLAAFGSWRRTPRLERARYGRHTQFCGKRFTVWWQRRRSAAYTWVAPKASSCEPVLRPARVPFLSSGRLGRPRNSVTCCPLSHAGPPARCACRAVLW